MREAHTFQRITAYIIDIILISLITGLLTIGLPVSQKYKEAEKESSALMDEYVNKKIEAEEYIDKLYETKYVIGKEGIVTSLVSIVVTLGYFAGLTFYLFKTNKSNYISYHFNVNN